MTDLISWLRQQLDTDEAEALARMPIQWSASGIADGGAHPIAEGRSGTPGYDYARVLRQVQAHRAILTAYEFAKDSPPPSPLLSHARGQNDGYRQGLREAVKALVSIYSDRDSYDEGWRSE